MRKVILGFLAFLLFAVVPIGQEHSHADCYAGYFNGAGGSGCLKCMSLGGPENIGVCREVHYRADCACSEFGGSSCVSSGGTCHYVFFWFP